jgi:hypothetical protein
MSNKTNEKQEDRMRRQNTYEYNIIKHLAYKQAMEQNPRGETERYYDYLDRIEEIVNNW